MQVNEATDYFIEQKERHENVIKALLKEEIPRSLHESGHSQSK